MADTKESILITALRLFAKDGYEAVSVSAIAGELGMSKSALYKHYLSKRDIFDNILARMEQLDARRALAYSLPEGSYADMPAAYRATRLEQLRAFSLAMFAYWTQDEFSACFRKMLTLEQYRSREMSGLYQQYLASGPLEYLEHLFFSLTGDESRAGSLAVELYAPMFLLYSVYDGAEDKSAVERLLQARTDNFFNRFDGSIRGCRI